MEIELKIARRQIHRTFSRAIGRSVVKILTELTTNADDSYRRLSDSDDAEKIPLSDRASIVIVFDRAKRKFSVIDNAEGMTDEDMKDRFTTYGKESTDRSRGYRTRSLFGKGLRDVLFTQNNGQVKSIKNGSFYNCRFRWKDDKPIIDIRPPSRATKELRKALRIHDAGTLVEFTLTDGVSNPQLDKLISSLSNFYMLRMINSSPHREVVLVAAGRRSEFRYPIAYRFPDIEVKETVEEVLKTELDTSIRVVGQIGLAAEELTQGEAPYVEREGGLLILDEDDAVLDLQLFKFDTDPAARRISGIVRLLGAGEYIRTKLNQEEPEEVLTETRDGFNRQHPFYRDLFALMDAKLEPIVSKLRELGRKPEVSLSEGTRLRHEQAINILNQLANEILGDSARVPVIPAHKRTPPESGIAFVNSHVSVKAGLITPIALLVNPTLVAPEHVIEFSSSTSEVSVEPAVTTAGDDPAGTGVIVKVARLTCNIAGLTAVITAKWKSVETTVEVTSTDREVLTPVNGLEFERDEYTVRVNAVRHLRLFVDSEKVRTGSEIIVMADSSALSIAIPKLPFKESNLVTSKVGEVQITVSGVRAKSDVIVTAACGDCVAGTQVSIVKREKQDSGKHGLFRGYRFEPLERKLQSWWTPDGYVLINTKDPVNERYFGDDPGQAVESHAHCQVRLADLILNECLQILVSQALENGKLDRRFPNNPEIDVRTYVDEKKYEIGALIHEKFVTKA